MSLIYVTGIETAGKTTNCNELKKRGYEAHDIDDGIAGYFNKQTGVRSDGASNAEKHATDWSEQNVYMMDRQQVGTYAKQAKSKLIFLCGTTQSDELVLDLFDKVIYLYLDEATLRRRMAKRREGEFAFASHEKEAVLSWHKSSEEKYRQCGATMLDASQPVERTADQILAAVEC